MRSVRPACLALLACLSAACAADKTLRVTSDPPGADVRLDGERIGRTPLEVPFLYYGVRRITLYKEGYQTYSQRIDFDPRFYARFPLDIVSEVVLPIGWRDNRYHHVELVRGKDLAKTSILRSVIDRADALRNAGPEGPKHLPDRTPVALPGADESESPTAEPRPEADAPEPEADEPGPGADGPEPRSGDPGGDAP